MSLKCRKCRQVLVTQQEALLTAHGDCVSANESSVNCASLQFGAVVYLQEDYLPSWVGAAVDEEGWMKGRLHCPKCHSRVGGFDFVSGQKCACGFCVLPAVHLIRSKVDQDVQACTVMQQHE